MSLCFGLSPNLKKYFAQMLQTNDTDTIESGKIFYYVSVFHLVYTIWYTCCSRTCVIVTSRRLLGYNYMIFK